jgi:NAD(P)H-nitrite reductase
MNSITDRTRTVKELVSRPDDSVIICRCEEITRGEIRQAVHDGMLTMNEVKRYLRTGMGLCQGQTCSRLVRSIIAAELGVSSGHVEYPISRAPARPITMQTYASDITKK